MHLKKIIATGLMVLTSGSLVIGFSTGPPDGVTLAPGEAVCTDCHLTNPLNVPGGTLSVSASALSYTSGDTLNLIVHLAKAGQSRWGFELTALSDSNVRIGTLLDTSIFTQLSTALNGRQYLKHTVSGTFAGTLNASPGWGMRWVPGPADTTPVTFYVAGNAANNNGFNTGDFIYAASLTVPYSPPVPCCNGLTGNVDCDAGENVDIGDLTALVDNLFISFTPLCCAAEADLDNNHSIDIGDLTLLVDNLFVSFTPLQSCQ